MKAPRVILDVSTRGPSKSALQLNTGPGGGVWGLVPDTALRAFRFQVFVDGLPQMLIGASPPMRAILCVIAYECITTRKELTLFLKASPDRLRLPGAARVSWERAQDTQKVDARSIHPKTEVALCQVQRDADWTSVIEQAERFLQAHYLVDPQRSHSCLEQVLEDAKAWWYQKLPGYLLSHVLHESSMPLLPDGVLARLVTAVADRAHPDQVDTDEQWLQNIEEEALGVSLDLANNQKPSPPQRTIDQLKAVCSVSQNEAGIRLATYLNKASTRSKVALVSQYLGTEGWIAAAAVSWVMHLLTYGSLRKSNPAMSTIATYVNLGLLPLCQALQKIGRSPGLMSPKNWADFHQHLITLIQGQQSAAVLSSIHVWAIRTFGCVPTPEIIFMSSDSSRVHTNMLWSMEQNSALLLAREATPDERTNSQCMVILALGIGGLFRIGELPSMTTADIEPSSMGLRVTVDPGRGLHGGKSIAARRVVCIEDPTAVSLILSWRCRRDEESRSSSSEEVLLFGDPKQRRGLYRFGQCTRMVNQVLKRSSGDDSISFHTLRHTGASLRMLRILERGHLPYAVDPLDELCHEIGHAGPDTLGDTYAHLGEFALRRAIDRAHEASETTSTEAALWLSKKPETLRQQKRRSRSPFKARFFDALLQGAAWKDHPKGSAADAPVPLATIDLPQPGARQAVDLTWVLQALDLIQGRTKTTPILLKLSCDGDQLKGICQAIVAVCRQMKSGQRMSSNRTLLPTASTDHHLQTAAEALEGLGWNFKVASMPALKNFSNAVIAQGTTVEAAMSASAWMNMQNRGVLDLEDIVATKVLVDFLSSVGLPSQCVVYRVQKHPAASCPDGVIKAHTEKSQTIRSVLTDAFNAPVRVEEVKPRRGFPRHYLLLSRKPTVPGRKAASAMLRMSEFHGIFFALCAYLKLKETGWNGK